MSYWPRSREAIRYTLAAHLVNAAFILIVFVLPAAYLLSNPSVPIEIGRGVIIISFLLGALLIADWYHMHMTNSFFWPLRLSCSGCFRRRRHARDRVAAVGQHPCLTCDV
jgi:predicted membrane metal-binding protein